MGEIVSDGVSLTAYKFRPLQTMMKNFLFGRLQFHQTTNLTAFLVIPPSMQIRIQRSTSQLLGEGYLGHLDVF